MPGRSDGASSWPSTGSASTRNGRSSARTSLHRPGKAPSSCRCSESPERRSGSSDSEGTAGGPVRPGNAGSKPSVLRLLQGEAGAQADERHAHCLPEPLSDARVAPQPLRESRGNEDQNEARGDADDVYGHAEQKQLNDRALAPGMDELGQEREEEHRDLRIEHVADESLPEDRPP